MEKYSLQLNTRKTEWFGVLGDLPFLDLSGVVLTQIELVHNLEVLLDS